MQVSYKKLFKLLIDRDMNKTDLRKLASLSPTTLAKLSKNELLSMEVLIRICMVLNVTFDEIMEISPHEEINKKGNASMDYQLVKQIRDNEKLRKSFNDLSVEVFDLSFENWYQNGFWTDKYIPYVLVNDGVVVANASVNIIDTVWNGTPKRYIQIGTVMTKPEYRNNGLSSRLIREIISDWKDRCDSIYLFANRTTLDFYPKFAFAKQKEYQCNMFISATESDFVKLDMDKEENRNILKRCYQKSNPFSALPMNDNYGLLMFYCGAFLKNCVYYSQNLDTVCVAMQNENTLFCFDIFGLPNCTLKEIVSSVADTDTTTVLLGFTPKDLESCTCEEMESEDTLFVLAEKDNIFKENKVMFPTLSHA